MRTIKACYSASDTRTPVVLDMRGGKRHDHAIRAWLMSCHLPLAVVPVLDFAKDSHHVSLWKALLPLKPQELFLLLFKLLPSEETLFHEGAVL